MTDLEYLKKYGDYTDENIKLVNSGVPVQYVVGNVYFYDSIIEVTKDTLIPRFETEELVDKTIKLINNMFDKKVDIIDLGTGSGCIAICLKKNVECNVDAIDISNKALEIANRNAKNNKADISFYLNNMLNNNNKKYDVIISNPPYIEKNEKIMDKVARYEPSLALYAEDNGLYYYDYILKNCHNNLNDKYLIAFEIGWWQGNLIANLIKKYMPNSKYKIEKDMEGKDRFVFITN